jgi:hypothetical protein
MSVPRSRTFPAALATIVGCSKSRGLKFPKAPTNYFAGSNAGLSEGCVSGFVGGNEEGCGSIVAGIG